MTFTVAYRDKKGVRTEERFEAESRSELFKILEERGIAAIRVVDGAASKPKGKVLKQSRSCAGKATMWTAAAGVALIAGGLWWFMSGEKPPATPPALEKPAPPKPKAEPIPPKPAKPEAPPQKKDGPPWPEKSPHPDGEWRHGEGPRSIAVTNGCLVTYPHCPGVQMILPHPAFAAPFKTLLDNEIARIVSSKPGDIFIDVPLPKDFDEKFADSLLVPIEITEDDTPEKAELKRQVKEARKVLVEAVKRGESPRQILIDEGKRLRNLMQTRDNYQRIIDEQIQNGASDQEISDIVNAANKALSDEGIGGKVHLPWKVKLRLQHGKDDGTITE